MDCLSPVAALAAAIEHQTGSTVLDVGLSLVAIIELVLVAWVGVNSISLASTETRSATAAAAAAAATAAATTTAGLGLGLSVGWAHWGQGVSTSTAG